MRETKGTHDPTSPTSGHGDLAGRPRLPSASPTTSSRGCSRAPGAPPSTRATRGRTEHDGEQLDREDRAALRRVAGLSTELADVTEVEYRQLRLERVVLVGLQTSGDAAEAEVSLRELAALAETAGSEVLDGLLQRRDHPDPGTYLGSGKAAELADLVASTGRGHRDRGR